LDISNENERRIAINHINAKLQLLTKRIFTAKHQIVGVDVVDISKGKISFDPAIARLFTNTKVGESAILKLATENRVFEFMNIAYERKQPNSLYLYVDFNL